MGSENGLNSIETALAEPAQKTEGNEMCDMAAKTALAVRLAASEALTYNRNLTLKGLSFLAVIAGLNAFVGAYFSMYAALGLHGSISIVNWIRASVKIRKELKKQLDYLEGVASLEADASDKEGMMHPLRGGDPDFTELLAISNHKKSYLAEIPDDVDRDLLHSNTFLNIYMQANAYLLMYWIFYNLLPAHPISALDAISLFLTNAMMMGESRMKPSNIGMPHEKKTKALPKKEEEVEGNGDGDEMDEV